MNAFKVAWAEGSLELQTERAAHVLVESFREEGREAKAYARQDDDWVEIPSGG